MRNKYLIGVFLLVFFTNTLPISAQDNFELVEIRGRGRIDDVVWLPDGRLAVFGAQGIWVYDDLNQDTEPTLIESAYGWIRSAAIGGDVLATGHQDGSITIWDAETLTVINHWAGYGTPATLLEISADGSRLVTSGSIGSEDPSGDPNPAPQSAVRVWQISDQMLLLKIPIPISNKAIAVKLSHSGQLAAINLSWPSDPNSDECSVSYYRGTVDIWDIDQGRLFDHFDRDGGVDMVFSPNDQFLVSLGESNHIIWDIPQGQIATTLETNSTFDNLHSAYSEEMLILHSNFDIQVWDAATWRILGEFASSTGYFGEVQELAVNPDSLLTAAVVDDEKILLWDLSKLGQADFRSTILTGFNRAMIRQIGGELEGFPHSGEEGYKDYFANSPDPGHIVLELDDRLATMDLFTFGDQWVAGAAYSGDFLGCGETKHFIFLAPRDKQASLFEDFVKTNYAISAMLFNPDDTQLIVGGEDGSIHWFNIGTGEEIQHWELGTGAIFMLAYNEDYTQLAAVDEGGLVRIWQIK